MAEQNGEILVVRGLKTYFPVRRGVLSRVHGYVHAVDGVDLTIRRGQTLGLVGESGSGKTTIGRTILGLIPATAGQVIFDGQTVLEINGSHRFVQSPRRMRILRRRIQIIFQDPIGSLDPRQTIGDIIAEPLVVHRIVPRSQRRARVDELLARVRLAPAYASRYPHEFSGGQRQRIGIARALASQPDFIVCDEPVSALDVSIQAQILNLLADLQDELGLSYLFIAHNLAVVEHFADEVAVMYLGRIVERAARLALYDRPTHPYTQALLAAAPQPAPEKKPQTIRLAGEIPSPVNPPPGCAFHTRCPLTRQLAAGMSDDQTAVIYSEGQPVRLVRRCAVERPELKGLPDEPGHLHACLLRQ